MSLGSKLTKESIYGLYQDNKDYVLPVLAIIASLFLFFIFIVPQLLSFPSRKQEVDKENEKLRKIKETKEILLNSDENLIDSQLRIASKALPPGKSFEEILNGISAAAALSGAQIENYKFESQKNVLPSAETEKSKYSSLLFEVSIIGTTKDAISFIRELYKTYPASDAISMLTSTGATNIKILFYYKSFPLVNPEDRVLLKNISAKESGALAEISSWNDTSVGSFIGPVGQASESAQSDSSPF